MLVQTGIIQTISKRCLLKVQINQKLYVSEQNFSDINVTYDYMI